MERLNNKNVLIVDDDERNTFALGSYLESLNMNVIMAANGEDAIAVLKKKTIDIILLDMMMPVMDGYETLAILKEEEQLKHIPVIAVTAKAMVGDKERCLKAGAWDYLSKPMDMKMLIDKLIRWII
ncbi:MAG: multi-sensor hybrid histidine kinase [Chitinophagaceae bacterium]|nr:multi-sensor hybrid histidine kinase [Chitinophagaceae bacterium]